MITKSEWQQANEEVRAEARERVGEGPSVDELIAFSLGRLSEADAERVREFMAANPDLAAMYAAEVPEEPRPGEPGWVSDEEVAAGWNAIQKRIPPWKDKDVARVIPFRRQIPAAFAAMLALVFGVLLYRAEQRVDRLEAELNRPLVTSEVVPLSPADGRRGPGDLPTDVTTDADAYHFELAIRRQPHFANYRIDLVGREGTREVLWSKPHAQRGEDDTFTIIVPRRLLPAGSYELHVYGLDGSRADLLGRYPIDVRR